MSIWWGNNSFSDFCFIYVKYGTEYYIRCSSKTPGCLGINLVSELKCVWPIYSCRVADFVKESLTRQSALLPSRLLLPGQSGSYGWYVFLLHCQKWCQIQIFSFQNGLFVEDANKLISDCLPDNAPSFLSTTNHNPKISIMLVSVESGRDVQWFKPCLSVRERHWSLIPAVPRIVNLKLVKVP